jgi:hypothetical protein
MICGHFVAIFVEVDPPEPRQVCLTRYGSLAFSLIRDRSKSAKAEIIKRFIVQFAFRMITC